MKLNHTALAVVLGCFSFSSLATNDNPYQHEVTIGASDTVNSDYNTDTLWGASYQYYFSPVSQDKGPYALNGWLAQTSNMGLNLGSSNDVRSYGVGGTFVTDAKWFVSANYAMTNFDTFDNPSLNNYGVALGYYLDEWTSISASYNKSEFDDFLGDPENTSYGLSANRFIPFANDSGLYLAGNWDFNELKATGFENSSNTISLDADYYVNKSWSVGLNYARNNKADDDNYGLQTSYFWRLSDSFSLITNISKSIEPDGDGFDVGLKLTGRF